MTDKPTVFLTGDVREDARRLERAMMRAGAPIYQRAGRLVTPIGDQLVPLDADMLREMAKEYVQCVKSLTEDGHGLVHHSRRHQGHRRHSESLTFRKWITTVARRTDNPAGDFVEDARDDTRLREDFKSLEDLRCHLMRRGACQGAID